MTKIVMATQSPVAAIITLPGCPMLVSDGLEPIPSLWLATLWQHNSQDTARSYAYHLKLWWDFLHNAKIKWHEANSSDAEAFQLSLISKAYTHRSINAIIYGILSFYKWTYKRGFIPTNGMQSTSALGTRGRNVERAVRVLGVDREFPRYNSKEEFDAILSCTPRLSPGLILRDELIAECGRYLGLRRKEVAGLAVNDFRNMPIQSGFGILELKRHITKGNKKRTVPVPPTLIHKMDRYVRVYRKEIIDRCKERDLSYEPPETLFLTVHGGPVTRQYISATWRVAAVTAGVPSRFHMNRHAAITAIVAAGKRLGKNGLAIARDHAGHADEATTEEYDHSEFLTDPGLASLYEEAWDDLG